MIQFITLIYSIATMFVLLFTCFLSYEICAYLLKAFQSTKHIKYERKQTSKTKLTLNRIIMGPSIIVPLIQQ